MFLIGSNVTTRPCITFIFQGIGASCNGGLTARGLSASEKAAALDLHNKLRSKVALGQEARGTTGPQPPAADMRQLVWDDELAVIAQRWAEQCSFGHDQERNVDRFKVRLYNLTRSGQIGVPLSRTTQINLQILVTFL